MNEDLLGPEEEFNTIKQSLEAIEEEALPIIEEISLHTLRARRAIGGPTRMKDNTIQDLPVDSLTLSREQVQLAILNQRLSERISALGYTLRSAEEFYKRQMEGHKVRLTQGQVVEEIDADGKKTGRTTRTDSVAAGVADSMKLQFVRHEHELYNQCQYRMDQFKGAYRSNEKTIDTLRSKVSYEKSNEHNA